MKKYFLYALLSSAFIVANAKNEMSTNTLIPKSIETTQNANYTSKESAYDAGLKIVKQQYPLDNILGIKQTPPPVLPNEIIRVEVHQHSFFTEDCAYVFHYYRRTFLGIPYGDVYCIEEEIGCV